jgi:hypothetical protein
MPFEVFPNTPTNPAEFMPFGNKEYQPTTHQLEPAVSEMFNIPPVADYRPVLRLIDAVSGPVPMATPATVAMTAPGVAHEQFCAGFHQSQSPAYAPSCVFPHSCVQSGYAPPQILQHVQQQVPSVGWVSSVNAAATVPMTHTHYTTANIQVRSPGIYGEAMPPIAYGQHAAHRFSSHEAANLCIIATAPPAGPAPGSVELPSVGSVGHAKGRCKPCAFLHVKGCENGAVCRFCHLCEAGEKKRRAKEKLASRRKAKHAFMVAQHHDSESDM